VSEAVLDVQDVWKRFDRRGAGAPQVVRWLGRRRREVFWALSGLSFTVAPGEVFGIVGANGSGKSTLLRLIGGVGRPTRGRVLARREVGAVLTLGDAFDPLLTGRENALTAALVAGFTRREARGCSTRSASSPSWKTPSTIRCAPTATGWPSVSRSASR
jgi:ABC-type polysaccharide/polyol phosphate transport system, ATPase component